MSYSEKKYDEIFMSLLKDAFEEKLISHDEMFLDYIANKQDISNFYVMLLAIHSEAIEEVYKQMTNVYNSSKVEYAEGIDLDDLGKIVNCSRPQATKASVELLFTYTGTINDIITIPAGVVVSTKNSIAYKTVEPLTFSNEDNSCTVSALSVNPGTNNRVVENQLTKLISRVNNVKVTNPKASTGGSNGYSDDEYRNLLRNWIKINQKGNEQAYLNYFSRVDGLADYKLIPNWDGTGTVKAIIYPATSFLLNKIYNDLQSDITQASEDIYVTAPSDKVIDIYINCNVDIDQLNPYSTSEKETIRLKILSKIKEYINNMKIGQDFIPLKLAVFLDNNINELKNIEFSYPSKPIVISDEEKSVLGNLTIDME